MVFGTRTRTVVKENGYEKKVVIKGADPKMVKCQRKVKFPTKAKAEAGAKRLTKETGLEHKAYYCEECGKHHIGKDHYVEPVELPMKIAGRKYLVELQGACMVKMRDVDCHYIFVVPHNVEENEYKILDAGYLIAYKIRQGIYRTYGTEKSEMYREFNNMQTMMVKDRVFFQRKLELHEDNMVTFEDARNRVINGLPFIPIDIRAGVAEETTPPPQPPKLKDTLPVTDPAKVDIYLGRAVFWTVDGRPYHREYKKCCVETCGSEIEIRSYLIRGADNELKGVGRKEAAEDGVLNRSVGRKEQWMCASCAAPSKKIGFEESKNSELVAAVGKPDIPVEKQEPQIQITHIDQQVLKTLKAVAENDQFSAEFVRGAALMAAELLLAEVA